jgi:hypothetical protein
LVCRYIFIIGKPLKERLKKKINKKVELKNLKNKNMKKIVSIFLVLFVFASLSMFSLVLAENTDMGAQGQNNSQSEGQQGNQQQDKDQEGQEQDENQGDHQQEQEREQEQEHQGEGGLINAIGQQLRSKTSNEWKSMIQEKRGEMIEEIKSMKGNLQKAYQNQNEVRTAVHAFLSVGEELVGDIGEEVSSVAKEFNNSIQETIKAEETIRNKNRILRFFTGGDQETAEELQNLVDQNLIRIQRLKELKGECDCEEEVKTLMQEQIQSMEQGQDKLQEMIQNEKNARGIWGWFKGLFGK